MPATRLDSFPHQALTRLCEQVASGREVALPEQPLVQLKKLRWTFYEWRKVLRKRVEAFPTIDPMLELLLPMASAVRVELDEGACQHKRDEPCSCRATMRFISIDSTEVARMLTAALEQEGTNG